MTACSLFLLLLLLPPFHAGSNLFLSVALTWKLFWVRCHCGEVGQLRPQGRGGVCVCGKSREEAGPLSGVSEAGRKGTTKADANSLKLNSPCCQPSQGELSYFQARQQHSGWPWGWPFTVSLSTVLPLCQSAPHPASSWGEGAKVVPAQRWANPGQSIASRSLNFPTPSRKLLASWPS